MVQYFCNCVGIKSAAPEEACAPGLVRTLLVRCVSCARSAAAISRHGPSDHLTLYQRKQISLTLIVFMHIATGVATRTIFLSDMRLRARLIGYRVLMLPPPRFDVVMICVSLAVWYLSGPALLWLAWQADPNDHENSELQAKLVLIAALTLNAVVLHQLCFSLLERSQPLSHWWRRHWLTVSASVSRSNCLWLFCALVGVAWAWNFSVTPGFVLSLALALALSVRLSRCSVKNLVLAMASRDAPKPKPDWVDQTIATVSDFAGMAARREISAAGSRASSANQNNFGRRVSDRRATGAADRRSGNARR